MKYKRLTAGVLSLSLLIGGIGTLPVVAAEKPNSITATAESDAMATALLDVKSRITIPSAYSDFEYNTSTTYGIPQYTFYWRNLKDDESKWDCPYIRVDYVNGIITSYTYFSGDRETYVGFGKLSDTEMKSTALKYFKALNPKFAGTIELDSMGSASLVGNTAYYTISRKEQGIAVDDNVAVIGVDKNTGGLVSAQFSWFVGAKFDDASKRVSVETANAAYKSETGIKVEYKLYTTYAYDDVVKKYITNQKVKAVYLPKNTERNEIDAITGKYTTYYDDMELYDKTYAYEWGSTAAFNSIDSAGIAFDSVSGNKNSAPMFSEAEAQAIKDESRFVTQEQVNKIVASDPYIKTEKGMVVKSRKVSEQTIGNKTTYELRTVYTLDTDLNSINLTVTMDALTGEIKSFSKYYSSKTYGNTWASEAVAKAKTAEIAKHYMGSKADGYVFDEYKTRDDGTDTTFIRVVNGINAPFDTVNTTIAPDGEITSFSYVYHDMAFPTGTLIGEDKVFENLLSKYPATLSYKGFVDLQLVPHTYLTYEYPDSFAIDAFSGTRLNYNGEPYVESKEKELLSVTYKDIAGHKYEKEIQRCVDYGIYATLNDTLNPDDPITLEEWGLMLCALRRGTPLTTDYYNDAARTEKVVDMFNDLGWGIEEKDYSAVLKQKLTNKEMAKFFVGMCGNNFDYLAEQPIFDAPYTDVPKNDPYCGYIAIAKAYGLTQDTNGMFNPNQQLTKADCYKLMYDWLSGGVKDDRFTLICGVMGYKY